MSEPGAGGPGSREPGDRERDAGEPPEVELAVGVGPWPGDPTDYPDDPRYDRELLAHGDRRNVADRYRYWSVEAITAELDTRRQPVHVAIENWGHDLNIGSIVRTSNAFLVAEVHIVGRRRWNRRGAMVTDRYQRIRHHDDLADLRAWASGAGVPIVAVDNVAGSVDVLDADLPPACVLLFGQEGPGLTAEALAAADSVVHIRQYGSTRSLNAGAAAAIVMHEWVRRHGGEPPA
ncbi:MAG: RNA methyltransferase [Actinomycetales bacterium]|nr:RNA methyltransferase [Actinomycetales bacterium]